MLVTTYNEEVKNGSVVSVHVAVASCFRAADSTNITRSSSQYGPPCSISYSVCHLRTESYYCYLTNSSREDITLTL